MMTARKALLAVVIVPLTLMLVGIVLLIKNYRGR